MQTYTPIAGEMISETAKRIVALANRTNDTVTAKFNDVELVTNPGNSFWTIVEFYKDESERRAEAYRNSPEGKQATREVEKRKQKLQRQMDEAMVKLLSLDFSNFSTVITWPEKVCDPSEYGGVVISHEQIVAIFRKNGYAPGANCGTNFDGENEENFARYLIGQALEGLQGVSVGGVTMEIHAIHPIFHKFADDWRKKFAYT